jgi:hypothetical protein
MSKVSHLAVGCWLLAVGCWLLAVGCWLILITSEANANIFDYDFI